MLIRFLICMFLTLVSFTEAKAADQFVKLEVQIAPELEGYQFLFQSPSYAVLALQNAGLNISLTKPVVIIDRTTFEIGPGKIKYITKKGTNYFYDVTLSLPLGKRVVFPLQIETSEISRGRLLINFQPSIAGLIPLELIEKVESKLMALGNSNAQKQLSLYLTKLDVQARFDLNQVNALDRIAFDAYTRAGNSMTNDKGISEPVSDQIALILTMIIWLVCFPVFLFILRRQRARQACSMALPTVNRHD